VLKRIFWTLFLVGPALTAGAGGSGLNVMVVVNQNSANSVQLGNEYCAQRGVPPQNLFRITNWTGGPIAWSKNDFEGYLQKPLLAALAASGATTQLTYVLLSMDIPYRVVEGDSGNSTTSVLFYGFKTNSDVQPGLPTTCSLPDFSSNSFAFSELPFEVAMPNTAVTNSLLAFMLTDSSIAGAEAILDRGRLSDSSFPTQAVYLQKTSDIARNVRFFTFDNAVFDSRIRGDSTLVSITSDSTAFDNIRGLLTGFATFAVPNDAFEPGSLCDSLTSFGGELFENSGQTPLLAFLEAGAAASYGTIVEPCNFLEKFPDSLAYVYQSRGFNAAEAYYQSVKNPYQGLFVGEPLSAPFAVRDQSDWTGLTNDTELSGQAVLPTATFTSLASNQPIAQVDLFVDGVFTRTITNISPVAGQSLALTINGSDLQYLVASNATLYSVVTDLAVLCNSASNSTRVAATAYGDRLEFQSLDLLSPGSNVLLSAQASADSALTPTRSQPVFLDTVAAGYLGIIVTNPTAVGDWLALSVTKTNGAQVSLSVTNFGTTNVADLCAALINAVSASPDLQGPDGIVPGELYADVNFGQFFLYARSHGWAAAEVQVRLTASANLSVTPPDLRKLEDNIHDLRPRNHLYLAVGVPEISLEPSLETTRLADGFHELTLVAYEGTSVRTQTHVTRRVQVRNTPLTATLTTDIAGTNTTTDAVLNVTVMANTNSIENIELFSTGGSLGVVTNQQTARFPVSTSFLGVGTHPVYALVTDTLGNRFRTRTTVLRIVPSIGLSISSPPMTLSWSSAPGVSYDILSSEDLSGALQEVDKITATGPTAQWPVPSGPRQLFYRVRLTPYQ
jgi:uncharacterized protein (TIGR03790 family)